MNVTINNKRDHTRAYLLSDAQAIDANKRATKEDTTRAFPASDVIDTLRFATWNLGSLTGRTSELSDALKRRNIDACCLQETKWRGSKSRDIGLGFKLIYNGTLTHRNGVAIALNSYLKDRIISINRKSDRLLAIKLALDNQPPLNIISAYAPQVGCSKGEKQDFWEDFDEVIASIGFGELKLIGGNLNGHVGDKTPNGCKHHGGFGYGKLNSEGHSILDFASRHNFMIINTCFKKKEEHLITYKSGGKKTQVDYILGEKSLISRFKNCKVIPGEPLTSQHRILVTK